MEENGKNLEFLATQVEEKPSKKFLVGLAIAAVGAVVATVGVIKSKNKNRTIDCPHYEPAEQPEEESETSEEESEN